MKALTVIFWGSLQFKLVREKWADGVIINHGFTIIIIKCQEKLLFGIRFRISR
jgi:hypothetical protein